MKLLGLTGGIGMGKSTAEQLLRDRGLPVADTDAIARQMVEPGQPALEEIRTAFGAKFIGQDGHLLRHELGRLVFEDTGARQKLEGILHPRIRAAWLEQADLWRSQSRPLGMVAIPLLFETGAQAEFRATICVACSAPTQRQRLLARHWSLEHISQRLRSQWPIAEKMSHSDYVVWNEAGLEVLGAQLDRVLSACAGLS